MPRELAVQVYEPQTNESILNGIRKSATDPYRDRVPRAVQADIQSSMKALASNKPTWNEFVSALVNQIGAVDYKNRVWSNPLAIFKGPMLEYGDTVEEIATGMIKSYVYDPNNLYMERILFGQHRPDAISAFHKINREVFYPITVNRDILRRAFTTEYGLSDFITGLMDQPVTSDQWDEFLTMAELFKEYELNGGFFRVNIDDVAAKESTETTAKSVLRVLREYAQILPFVSTQYNAAGVPSFANKDELILIGTPAFVSAIDVNALAAAFNVTYAEIPYRTVVLPEQYLPEGVQAIITTSDFFVVRDTLFETTSQDNAVGLTENFFLHHHGIVSASTFVPAVAFTTGAGTVIELVETPVTGIATLVLKDEDGDTVTELTRGRNHVVTATVSTSPANGENTAVRWSISGNSTERTRVSQTGILTVDVQETANTITVVGTPVDGTPNAFTVSATYDVTGTLIQQWPNPFVQLDVDTDGIEEVTPLPLTVDADDNVIIPSVAGVQYKRAGTDVADGSIQHITASTVFTAVAKTGKELTAGATATWTLAP